MADNREGQMKATQNVKVGFAILVTAAVLCVGVIPSWAGASYGQSPQNDDDRRRSQDPGAQDRDSMRDRDSGDSRDDSGTMILPAGYVIPVRLADEVNSSHDKAGDLFTGTVDPSVLVNAAAVK